MGIFLSLLTYLPNILQLILSGIRVAEEIIPGEGEGEKKLAFVGDVVSKAQEAVSGAKIDPNDVTTAIKPLVDATVSVLNAMGILKKSSSGPPSEAGVG